VGKNYFTTGTLYIFSPRLDINIIVVLQGSLFVFKGESVTFVYCIVLLFTMPHLMT